MTNTPIIVVEGPDGAGKTTLINELFPTWNQVHRGPLANPFKTYVEDICYVDKLQVPLVLDRFFYSELVYGPLVRAGSKLTWAHCRMLERLLLAHEVVVVFALPPFETCQANYLKNHENEYMTDKTKFLQLYNGYKKLIEQHQHTLARVPVFVYDYTTMALDEGLKTAILNKQAPWNSGPGVGCFRSGVTLLVGDRCSHDRYGSFPFVDDTGCSLWLAQRLEEWGVPEKQLYWVNAFVAGRVTDFSFVGKLAPRQVIALGLNASMELQRQGVRHQTVVHPQHHKRFAAGKQYPLFDFLKGAS